MAGESFFQRLKQGLTKSRENLLQNIGSIFQNRRWDEESLDAMEESLIAADVGVKATDKLMEALRRQSPGGNGDIAEEIQGGCGLAYRQRPHPVGDGSDGGPFARIELCRHVVIQLSKPSRIICSGNSRPMKTTRLSRASPSFHLR